MVFSSGLNGLPFSMPITCVSYRSSGPKLSRGSYSTSIAKNSKKRKSSGNTVSMSCFELFMNSIGGGDEISLGRAALETRRQDEELPPTFIWA